MINKFHGRTLKLVYNDYESTFEDLLTKNRSFTVHHYKNQILAIELGKVHNNISQTIIGELFTRNNNDYYPIIYAENLISLFRKLGLY